MIDCLRGTGASVTFSIEIKNVYDCMYSSAHRNCDGCPKVTIIITITCFTLPGTAITAFLTIYWTVIITSRTIPRAVVVLNSFKPLSQLSEWLSRKAQCNRISGIWTNSTQSMQVIDHIHAISNKKIMHTIACAGLYFLNILCITLEEKVFFPTKGPTKNGLEN